MSTFWLTIILLIFVIRHTVSVKYPTLYETYTEGGILSGLIAEGNKFTLNGKELTIFSGSLHYFRVHQNNWRQILLKFKANGLNAVQLYSPWNLHEERPKQFDFESGMLNITDFLIAIKEADLFALYRPGPYICAELDFGGLPSWLLRDPNMKVRFNYRPYLDAIDRYWSKLFSIVKDFQFTTNGGPIIGVQIENELGSYGNTQTNENDKIYMKTLGSIARKYGIKELLFTSDGPEKQGSIEEYFPTLNFNKNAINNLSKHKRLHPNKPLYVAEFWTGWFDNWGTKHHTMDVAVYTQLFEQIVFQMNSSINLYMFIGGTNFGFNAGNVGILGAGDVSSTIVTSYDYDAPLSESGNYTEKYWKTKELIEKFNKERNVPKIAIPSPPPPNLAKNYGVIEVREQLPLYQILPKINSYNSKTPVFMENINIGTNFGQSFGFTLYRTTIPETNSINFTEGRVNDRAAILVDNKQIAFVYHKSSSFVQTIPTDSYNTSQSEHTLDILVENFGRVFFGKPLGGKNQRKGLEENITIDNRVHVNWDIYALDFKHSFVDLLKHEEWSHIQDYRSPAFYRTHMDISDEPKDTYLKLDDWTTSVVFINGFNLGRYWNIGPVKTLYIPSHLLNRGSNEIIIFETQANGKHIEFIDRPIFE